MPVDLANLANLIYTILVALVGLAFFTGRLSMKVDRFRDDRNEIENRLNQIFHKLDELTRLAALNEAWHHNEPERT